MNHPKMNWYDVVLDLKQTAGRQFYQSVLHYEKGSCTGHKPAFCLEMDTNNPTVQDRNKPLRVLVNSQKDVMDPCNEVYLEGLHRAAEETNHQYFLFTKHPLSFIQKPLFHRENIWTGVSFAPNTGLPFGAEELHLVFPNNNWVWHIDLNRWTEEQTSMIKRGIKWLILDCAKPHNNKEEAAPLPCLEPLLKQADKENIPVFMSNRLSENVPASMCRRTLPEELKARLK